MRDGEKYISSNGTLLDMYNSIIQMMDNDYIVSP